MPPSSITVKDWLYIAAVALPVVGGAYLINYRLGKLEARFDQFSTTYVTRETIELLKEQGKDVHKDLQRQIDELKLKHFHHE